MDNTNAWVLDDAAVAALADSGAELQEHEKLHVDKKERLIFYICAFLRDMPFGLTGMLTYFYIDVMGLAGVALAAVSVITRIWDGINDPLVGIYYDKRKYVDAKARPFFRITMIPGALALVAMFFWLPAFMDNMVVHAAFLVTYAVVTYAAFELFQTANSTAFMSLYNSISPNADERTKVVSHSRLFSTGGSAAIGGLIPILISLFDNDNVVAKAYIYFITAAVIAACFVTFNILMSRCVKERTIAPKKEEQKQSIKEMMKKFVKNRPLMLIILSSSISGLINAGSVTMYFYQYTLGNAALQTYVGFATVPTFIFGALLVPVLAKRFDKYKVIIACCALRAGLTALYLIVGYHQLWFVFLVNILMNSVYAVQNVLYWNMVPDTVDYVEWKTGERGDGMVYAAEGFIAKVMGAFGTVSTAIIIAVIAFVPNAAEQSESTMKGLFYVPTAISLVSIACSAIPYFFFKFGRKQHEQILIELRRRKEDPDYVFVEPKDNTLGRPVKINDDIYSDFM